MHELFKQKNLPYLNVKECPNCHQSIPINSNVCPSCNYDLTIISIKKEEKVDDTKLSQQAETVKETTSQKEEIQPLCPSCGKLINPKKDFCPYCGFKLKVDRCLCCGSFLADDVLYCPNCGTKRGSSGNPTIGQKLKTDDESDTEIIKKLSSDNVENNSTHEEEPVIETEEIKEPQVEEPNEEKTQPDFNIKKKKYLSKKRIFLLFVLIFILGSMAVLLFTNYIYINSFIYNNETFIVKENSLNGVYIIKTFINDLINQKVLCLINLNQTVDSFVCSMLGDEYLFEYSYTTYVEYIYSMNVNIETKQNLIDDLNITFNLNNDSKTVEELLNERIENLKTYAESELNEMQKIKTHHTLMNLTKGKYLSNLILNGEDDSRTVQAKEEYRAEILAFNDLF